MMEEQEQLEPGWEFTLPAWVVKPYNWLLAFSILIFLISLAFLSLNLFRNGTTLFNKMQAAKSVHAEAQSSPQTATPK